MRGGRGRCRSCGKVFALKGDGTLRGHGYRTGTGDPWCPGSSLHPWFRVGDIVESTINGTVGRVTKAECVYGFRGGEDTQRLTVKKITGEWGWAATGEEFPESNSLVVLYQEVI